MFTSNSIGPQRRQSLENGGQQQVGGFASSIGYSQQNAALVSPTGGQDNQKLGQLQRLKDEFQRSRSHSASEGSSKPFPNSQKIQNSTTFRLPNNESAKILSSSNENRLGAPLAPSNQHLSRFTALSTMISTRIAST